MSRPILLAASSDHHAGSTVGVCPPEGVRLDDAGSYLPSKPQRWLWNCWVNFWQRVAALREAYRAELWVAHNGDMTEGDHHATHQIISRNPDAQMYVAKRVFSVPADLQPEKTIVVRGTEAHTGSGGSTEEGLAGLLGAEKDPETHTLSRWRWRSEIYGNLFDFQHHGRMGQRPWTKQNVVNLLAAQIFYEHAARGLRHPDFAVRSHMHQYADSHDAHPVRLIGTPAWQLKTGFVHKVAPENIADVGGVSFLIHPSGEVDYQKYLYVPTLPVFLPHPAEEV